jgi:hypothetical protein
VSADTLFYCFGLDSTSGRIAKLVNNRRYPLEVTARNATALDNAVIAMSFAEIYRQQGHVILMPRETVTYQINQLPDRDSAQIGTRLSNWALGLGVVDQLFETIVSVLVHGDPKQAKAAVEVLMVTGQCPSVLSSPDFSLSKVIKACLTPDTLQAALEKVFGRTGGAAAVLLAPAVLGVELADTTRGVVNALGDRTSGRDRYTLTISRTPVSDCNPPAITVDDQGFPLPHDLGDVVRQACGAMANGNLSTIEKLYSGTGSYSWTATQPHLTATSLANLVTAMQSRPSHTDGYVYSHAGYTIGFGGENSPPNMIQIISGPWNTGTAGGKYPTSASDPYGCLAWERSGDPYADDPCELHYTDNAHSDFVPVGPAQLWEFCTYDRASSMKDAPIAFKKYCG